MAGTPPATDEQGLIHAAKHGDLDAFNQLVLHYQDNVYSVTYRIMGEAESAADTTQDAFISAFRRIETYRGGNFRSWLLRIATNTCYDELRRRKRRPATRLEELPGADSGDGPALISQTATPEQTVQQHELSRALEACIQALHDDQRIVLILSDIEDFSYQEIAQNIGAQLGTVKSRLSRARANVRECLQDYKELLPASYRLIDED